MITRRCGAPGCIDPAGIGANVAAEPLERDATKMIGAQGVSVIICTWNRANSLQSTLDSLARQKGCGQIPVEILVVDNNSTDDTRGVVGRAAAGWPLGDLRYLFEPRQGKQFALNAGIAAAKGEVLAFTDDDVCFDESWLARIWEVFSGSGIELAGGRTLLDWQGAKIPAWFDPQMSAILAGVDLGVALLRPPPAGYAPAGSNLVARRRLFDRVGGFSETHFRHMDHEFGLRCANAGVDVAYVPDLVVHAPVDARCLTKRYFRRWAFKAGIAREAKSGESNAAPGAPPAWIYRQFVQDMLVSTLAQVLPDSPGAFSRELRAWRALGTIASYWRFRLRPNDYGRWVEAYSQKRGGLY